MPADSQSLPPVQPRYEPLPDYERPPVKEVLLSVQFAPIRGFGVVHFGPLWEAFRARYRKFEPKQPLEALVETCWEPSRPDLRIQFRGGEAPPLPRVWFLDEPGNRLLQVQSEYFIHNWRKVVEGDACPRYEAIRQTFVEEFRTFEQVLRDTDLGPIELTQCEVTYVNEIAAGDCWTRLGQVEGFLSLWNGPASNSALEEPEDVQLALRYHIRDDEGNFVGRLHAMLEPRRRVEDNAPVYHLNLTARGRPIGKGVAGVLAMLDLGREKIVRTFTAITSPQQHRVWGRRDAS